MQQLVKPYCVKSVLIWSYSGTYLLVFGLNMERYSVYTENNSEYGHFSRGAIIHKFVLLNRFPIYNQNHYLYNFQIFDASIHYQFNIPDKYQLNRFILQQMLIVHFTTKFMQHYILMQKCVQFLIQTYHDLSDHPNDSFLDGEFEEQSSKGVL